MSIEDLYSGMIESGVPGRVAVALATAEPCMAALSCDELSMRISRKALDLAWAWLNGADTKPEELAIFVDAGHEDQDLDLAGREVRFNDGSPAQHAVIAISLAVGYAARKAYERAGRTDMSESIWEMEDYILEDFLRAVEAVGVLDPGVVVRQLSWVNQAPPDSRLSRSALLDAGRSSSD